ncbi:MAG TPA: DUF3566 domain-containing protein [Actinomycetes bacterium]|nr:DUF3566 domain-containing protein [Actinomycetes bacterium]
MTTTSGGRPAGASPPSQAQLASQMSQGTVLAPAGNPLVARQRRVRLTVNRVDPWTVLRLAFLLSVAAAIITIVAVMMLWMMLSAAGVFSSVDDTLQSVLGDGALTITQYFSFGRVFSVALLIGAIDVVLITALSTIGAFLYNLAASLTGGLEMTVTEDS